jgi:hypothetical protein
VVHHHGREEGRGRARRGAAVSFNSLLAGGARKRLFEEWCDQAPTLNWLRLEDKVRPVYVQDLGRRLVRKDDVGAASRDKAIALGTKEEEVIIYYIYIFIKL